MILNEIENLRAKIGSFMSKIKIKDNVECWEWQGGQNKVWELLGAEPKHGYGAFRIGNKRIQAHKFSYLLFYGEVDDNLFTCHACDNRRWVNPFHLFQGTHQDNMQDKVNKGRCGNVGRKKKR